MGANCRPCLTCPEYAVKLAALSAAVAGRALYLSWGCDYHLEGSIGRGSKIAQEGHAKALGQLNNYFGKCIGYAINAGCLDVIANILK